MRVLLIFLISLFIFFSCRNSTESKKVVKVESVFIYFGPDTLNLNYKFERITEQYHNLKPYCIIFERDEPMNNWNYLQVMGYASNKEYKILDWYRITGDIIYKKFELLNNYNFCIDSFSVRTAWYPGHAKVTIESWP